jgi:hypothetical protein
MLLISGIWHLATEAGVENGRCWRHYERGRVDGVGQGDADDPLPRSAGSKSRSVAGPDLVRANPLCCHHEQGQSFNCKTRI